MKKYVQYGCGLSAPLDWINFDSSPTLRIQNLPILGTLLKSKLNVIFPSNVLYGDIIKGLPFLENSIDGLYCSHTLEHLSLFDLKKSLKNSYKILKKGGIFRCVLPDLEYHAKLYLNELERGEKIASINFMNATILGVNKRDKNLSSLFKNYYGNANHLWMWDRLSLIEELKNVGFSQVKICSFNDSDDTMFKHVEDESRFINSLAIESIK